MRYIVGFLITIGLIILAFILILRGGGGPTVTQPNVTRYTSTSTVMQLTIDGPINAQLDHRQIRITVGRDQVTAAVLQGYTGTVMRTQSFANNQTAYADFLHALQKVGFTKGTKASNLQDERGFCPTGDRFVYEIIDGSQTIQRYWHATCGQGSYQGNSAQTNQLFRAQVPKYDQFTSGVGL